MLLSIISVMTVKILRNITTMSGQNTKFLYVTAGGTLSYNEVSDGYKYQK
jgi:hypothetical protein